VSADAELSHLLERMWKAGQPEQDAVGHLRSRAIKLCNELTDPVVAARVTDALTLIAAHDVWEERLAGFRTRARMLLTRNRQVDQLGDASTPVEAVFDILDGDLDELDPAQFDVPTLRSARTSSVHSKAASKLLSALQLASFNPAAAAEFAAVTSSMSERGSRFGCHVMFADASGRGHVLGVGVKPGKGNGVTTGNKADEEMGRQSEAVLDDLFPGTGAAWFLEWDIAFGGNSIGLPMWIAGQAELEEWSPDPLLAATGRVTADGSVHAVGGVAAKVSAAARHGFRRIIVPHDNFTEAGQALQGLRADAALEGAGESLVWFDPDVKLIGVKNVSEVRAALDKADTSAALSRDGMVRLLIKCLPRYGLDLAERKQLPDRDRLSVAGAQGVATIDIHDNKGSTVVPGGSGSAREAVEQLIADQLPPTRIQTRPHLSVTVKAEDRKARLVELIERSGAVKHEVKIAYQSFRYVLSDAGSTAYVDAYTSGKVVVHGTAPAWDRFADIALETLKGLSGFDDVQAKVDAARAEREASTAPAAASNGGADQKATGAEDGPYIPHIGTDEAGKGDYFGPLVCAACYVDEDSAKELDEAGVRDSKKLADSTVLRLADEIKELIPGKWSVRAIYPERYNSLQVQMRAEGRGLNSLVAWGHAACIRQLEEHGIYAPYALVDKFADESFFDQRASAGKQTKLELRTKAESDVAVAAASILARARFLTWLADTSKELGMKVPKGAGPQVIEAAKALVAEHGPEVLDKYTKVSFKTTKTVLGD